MPAQISGPRFADNSAKTFFCYAFPKLFPISATAHTSLDDLVYSGILFFKKARETCTVFIKKHPVYCLYEILLILLEWGSYWEA